MFPLVYWWANEVSGNPHIVEATPSYQLHTDFNQSLCFAVESAIFLLVHAIQWLTAHLSSTHCRVHEVLILPSLSRAYPNLIHYELKRQTDPRSVPKKHLRVGAVIQYQLSDDLIHYRSIGQRSQHSCSEVLYEYGPWSGVSLAFFCL